MTARSEFNFIGPDYLHEDLDLFFGPLIPGCPEDEFFTFGYQDCMAHIMFKARIFSSVSEARKNGWNKPIPLGFSDIRAGKNKIRITILNPI